MSYGNVWLIFMCCSLFLCMYISTAKRVGSYNIFKMFGGDEDDFELAVMQIILAIMLVILAITLIVLSVVCVVKFYNFLNTL